CSNTAVFLTMRGPTRSPLFPYTTLFRSGYVLDRRRQREAAGLAGWVHGFPSCRTGADYDCRSCSEQTRQESYARSSHSRPGMTRSEEHTSELQSQSNLVCRLLLEIKNIH